jgi:antitoxin component YwqK of YwqJK toxin-antitoxin module
MTDLNIAEILHDTGGIHYRYSQYPSPDGAQWIRHGLFVAYHKNGQTASEGNYVDGLEEGLWRDFHENGQLAAEGRYSKGKEVGKWRFWNTAGSLESEEERASE